MTDAQTIAKKLAIALRRALQWIDAVPEDVVLPAMPGFDRDEVEELLAEFHTAKSAPTPKDRPKT